MGIMSKKSDAGKLYDIEGALEHLRANRNAEGILHFFQELRGADFLVPCQGKATNVAVMNMADGSQLMPVFSNVEEIKPGLQHWKEVTALKLEFLSPVVLTQPQQFTGMVINPLGKNPVLLKREEILEAARLLKAYNDKGLN